MKRSIVHEHFKNLDMLLDTFEERPLNKAFEGAERIASEVYDDAEWSGTKTYKEAIDVLKEGYKKPLDEMKKAVLKLGEMNKHERPRLQNSVVGFVPNVPNALMNLPQTMINKERMPNKSKTIHLTYSFCALADIKTDQIIKGGINFISLVNSLEKQGYRVALDVIFITLTNKTASALTVNLKQYGQNLNLLKLAFPLVHPAMLRRVSFKWLETTPNLKDRNYSNGSYGKTLGAFLKNSIENEKNFLKDNHIIKGDNSYYCNVYQAFKSDTVEELAQLMNIKK